MSYLTEIETEVYTWIDHAPCACESYVDDNGNIVITALINEQESERN